MSVTMVGAPGGFSSSDGRRSRTRGTAWVRDVVPCRDGVVLHLQYPHHAERLLLPGLSLDQEAADRDSICVGHARAVRFEHSSRGLRCALFGIHRRRPVVMSISVEAGLALAARVHRAVLRHVDP